MMNKKQMELLKFCGFEIDIEKNIITDTNNKKSITTIIYEPLTGFFTLKISNHRFIPNDYDSAELFSIDFNRKLGLVYELNKYLGGDK